MVNFRSFGVSHLYLDEKYEDFSNLGVGLMIRGLGHSLRVAYIDVKGTSTKFTNFLENLSLNYSFVKDFSKLYGEIFTFKNPNKISRSIIPIVEFNTIDLKRFISMLSNYDLIIFDNVDISILNINTIKEILRNKQQLCEIIFIVSEKTVFNSIKSLFDIQTILKYEKSNSLLSKKGIITISGEGKGKSLFSFGFVIKNFIFKQNVKLIFFDKGDSISGEIIFFKALKKWSKNNNFYGEFDFVVTGCRRYFANDFREKSLEIDKREAKNALMLLETSLRKQTPVIADELLKVLENKILEKKEILNVLNKVNNELLITGDKIDTEIKNLSKITIEFKDLKIINNLGLKQGIDF